MPIKERRLKILLLFFLLKDISFDYVKLTPENLELFDLVLNQKTKGTLSSMLKEGLLEKKEAPEGADSTDGVEKNTDAQKQSSSYRLTDKGFYRLCLTFPTFRYLKDDWDGVWRIISYEIPEKKRHLRDRLRREMEGWGLGPWHRSFWMTSHPVITNLRDLVYGKEEAEYIQAFESTHMFGDMEVMIEKIWNKNSLEKNYRELFKEWHSVLSSDKTKNEKFMTILFKYIKLLKTDPGLPPALVGKKWISFEAFNIFKEIRGILLPA